MTACKFESLTASPGRRDGFRLTPLRTCSCGRGRARARLSCSPWSVRSGRPASSRQRRQACAQRRGDRDSGRARRGFSRPPSGLKWPRGVSSFMTQRPPAPATISPEAGMTCHPSVVQIVTDGKQRRIMNFAFSRPSSKITRMSSPGFQWRVRGLVRAALLDDSGQTNACCALLVTPTRGPERLEGCAQPPHQQERTRPEVAGSARHQAAATRSESVKSTDRGKYIARIEQGTYTPS